MRVQVRLEDPISVYHIHAGIGLTSVRGTGTSGYVQTNKFNIRRRPEREERKDEDKRDVIGKRQANGEIIEHNRKREVEVKVYQYRVGLEDDGCVGCIDMILFERLS